MPAEDRATKALWTGVYGRGAATYGRVKFFSHWGRRLVELANIPRGARVLDVATGRGAALFPAAEQVGSRGRAIGIDLAEPMVQETGAEIRQRGLKNIEVRRMDAEHLEFPNASFDCVLCGFAVMFFPQVHRAFAEFTRVLKPRGRLALTSAVPVTTPEGRGAAGLVWELLRTYQLESPRLRERLAALREVWQEAQALSWPDRQAAGATSWPRPDDLEETLRQAGFDDIQFVTEEADIVAADEEEWWAWQWSHMPRSQLELLEPEMLERFKAAAFERLQSFKELDGIHGRSAVMLTVATKPGI